MFSNWYYFSIQLLSITKSSIIYNILYYYCTIKNGRYYLKYYVAFIL